MVSSTAIGIALISGSGGTGRTTAALNLSYKLAGQESRVLLADMCFGWGGLTSFASHLVSYETLLDCDEDYDGIITRTAHGFDLLTCIPQELLEPSVNDFKKFAWLISRLNFNYDYIIFDTPAGGHPLALLAAGMSRRVFLFIRPDAVSFATSFRLLKSLHSEGIYERVGAIFSFVRSAEHAASLKTRFDLITGRYIGSRISSGGFIPASGTMMSEEFVLPVPNSESVKIIENFSLDEPLPLQNETELPAHGRINPGWFEERR